MKASDIVSHVIELANREDLTSPIVYTLLNRLHTELQLKYNFNFMHTNAYIMMGSGTGQPQVGDGSVQALNVNFTMAALPVNFKQIIYCYDYGGSSNSGARSLIDGDIAAKAIDDTFYVPPIDRDIIWLNIKFPNIIGLEISGYARVRQK